MVGDMIKAARRERHLTQDEFASKLGINRATLSKYESNNIEPSTSMIIQIAKELKVPVSFLFGEASGQVLSYDFQMRILSVIQERVLFLLNEFDPEDLFATYGTYNVYEVYMDLFDPKMPIPYERVESIADDLSVSTEYLLGVVEDPSDTIDSIQDKRSFQEAIDALSALNNTGLSKAAERIKELAEIPRYCNNEEVNNATV